ncbi:MAG: hypothetical protein WDN24_05980 [Sphingomonas sp.]
MFIWTPNLLAPFVGGWVVLKIAAGWQRYRKPEYDKLHLIALVGSVISFSMAIAGGLLVTPESISAIAAAK